MATKSSFITSMIPDATPPTGDAASFGARLQANSKARMAAADAATKQHAAACAQPMRTTRSTMRQSTDAASAGDSDSGPAPKGFAPSAR